MSAAWQCPQLTADRVLQQLLTRWDLQEVLMEVWTRNQVTAIMVTHDVDEAILLADRVVMMTSGPRARVGKILPITLPRPRSRRLLLVHPEY
jgi:nitrate/nitrite transport system ATP-binding protein